MQNYKTNNTILNLVKLLKNIIASNSEELSNKFIKKIRRHHLVNLLSLLNITNKNNMEVLDTFREGIENMKEHYKKKYD